MSKEKWFDVVKNASGQIGELRRSAPKVLGGFSEFGQAGNTQWGIVAKNQRIDCAGDWYCGAV